MFMTPRTPKLFFTEYRPELQSWVVMVKFTNGQKDIARHVPGQSYKEAAEYAKTKNKEYNLKDV